MVEAAVNLDQLRGRTLAFTGRMFAMTQTEAAAAVAEAGGRVVAYPSRQTDVLVVGDHGLPLASDGRVSRSLERARELQGAGHKLEVWREQEFLSRLTVGAEQAQVDQHYTMAQLVRLLGVSRDRLRRWMRAGLLQPAKTVHRLAYFDFREVASAKALWDLIQAGVPVDRVRASLSALESWLPGARGAMVNLTRLGDERNVLIRIDEELVADATGQLYFPFPDLFGSGETESASLKRPAPRSGDEWFERGLDCEELGRLEEAEESYRQALALLRPTPELCFNLGNVLYALRRKEQAIERFLQAIELDPEFIEAWNNLGNTRADLGDTEKAIEAYQRALSIEAGYADAHFNLAECLSQSGRKSEAAHHWRAYLRLDPRSTWAAKARERLREDEV